MTRYLLSAFCAVVFIVGLTTHVQAEDFNNTYVHFLLTSGQNVKLELDKQRTFVSAIRFEVEMERLKERMARLQKAMADSGLPNGVPVESAAGEAESLEDAVLTLEDAVELFNQNVEAMIAYRKAKSKDKETKPEVPASDDGSESEGEDAESIEQIVARLHTMLESVLNDFRRSAGLITDFQPVALAFLYSAAVLDCENSDEAEFYLQSAYVLVPDLTAPEAVLKVLGKKCENMAKAQKSGRAALQVESMPAATTVTVNGKSVASPLKMENLPEGTYFVRV